jgi:hypothetical protein
VRVVYPGPAHAPTTLGAAFPICSYSIVRTHRACVSSTKLLNCSEYPLSDAASLISASKKSRASARTKPCRGRSDESRGLSKCERPPRGGRGACWRGGRRCFRRRSRSRSLRPTYV